MATEITNQEEALSKELMTSLNALKMSDDASIVSEAKNIENAVNSLIEIAKSSQVKDTVTNAVSSVKSVNESLVSKYGLVTARIIEFVAVVGYVAWHVYFG